MFGKIGRLAYGLNKSILGAYCVSLPCICSFNTSKLKSPVIIMFDIPVSTASVIEFSMLVKYSASELGGR